MSDSQPSPPPAGRTGSPLCDSRFRKPSTDLHPVIPPRWMGLGLVGSIAGAILVGIWVLLSPMEEFEDASGVVRPSGNGTDERPSLVLYAAGDRIDQLRPGQLVRFRSINHPDRLAPSGTGTISELEDEPILRSGGESSPQSLRRGIHVQIEILPADLAVGEGVEAEIAIGSRPLWQLLLHRPGNRM